MPKLYFTEDGYPFIGDEAWQSPFDDPNALAPIVNQRAAERVRNAVVRNGVAPRTIPAADALGAVSNVVKNVATNPAELGTLYDMLTGSNGQQRMVTWPERMVRTAAGTLRDVSTGDFGTVKPNELGLVSDEDIGARANRDASGVNALSNIVMGGGMPVAAATKAATLGAVGSRLKPAVRLGDRVYPESTGPLHIDVKVPDSIFMNKNSEMGFVDPEGNFLTRDEALQYASKNNLIKKGEGEHRDGGLDSKSLKLRSGSDEDSIAPFVPAPVWHSATENAVANASNEFASGAQWLGMLKNAKGLKKEELEWLGLPDYLQGQDKVSKADLEAYVRAHKIEVKDALNTNKGYDRELEREAEGEMDDFSDRVFERWGGPGPLDVKIIPEGGHFHLMDDNLRLGTFGNRDEAQKAQEEFLKHIKEYRNSEHKEPSDLLYDRYNEAEAHAFPDEDFLSDQPGRYQEYQLPGGTNYNELLLHLPGGKKFQPREGETAENFNRREELLNWIKRNPDDAREYDVSDIAKRFHVTDEEAKDAFQFAQDHTGNLAGGDFHSSHWDEPNVLAHVRFNDRTINGKKTLFMEEMQSDWHQQGHREGYKDENGIIDRTRFTGKAPVPDAPFKKSWHELALKRMLRYAAENGYDAIGWTPGEVQNARWPGSNHSKLYDEMLPQVAKKFGKVEQSSMQVSDTPLHVEETKGGWGVFNEMGERRGGTYKSEDFAKQVAKDMQEKPVHIMQLSPELKETAMHKGFPLFVNGRMVVPVQDPFNNKIKKDESRVPQGNKTPKFQPDRISGSYAITPSGEFK